MIVNSNIVSIDLKKNNLQDKGAKILIKTLARTDRIIHLDLTSNGISPKGVKKIFNNLSDCHSLISLNIGNSSDGINKNRIGYKGSEYLCDYLRFSSLLQFLDIRNTGL
jgi:Ran GTPase-activating protein (RanGAP) involved in mRNA processing and transport